MSATTAKTNVSTGPERPKFIRPLHAKREQRPKIRTLDLVWIFVLAVIPQVLERFPRVHTMRLDKWIIPFANHWSTGEWVADLSASLIGPALYLSLLKNRDKSGPMIASALCATSFFIVHAAHEAPVTGLYTLLLVVAYAFVSFDLPFPSAALLAAATALRPDGIVFAAAIFACLLLQKERYAAAAGITYLVLAAAEFVVLHRFFKADFHLLFAYGNARLSMPWIVAWAMTPPFVTCWWFVFPFCGEMTNSVSRRRYAPAVFGLVAYLIAMSVVSMHLNTQSLLPAVPFLYLAIGLGLARIIPMIAGDLSGVGLRYFVAIFASISLIAVCIAQQWHMLRLTGPVKPAAFSNSTSLPSPQVRFRTSEIGLISPGFISLDSVVVKVRESIAAQAALIQVNTGGRFQ